MNRYDYIIAMMAICLMAGLLLSLKDCGMGVASADDETKHVMYQVTHKPSDSYTIWKVIP